MYHSKKSLAVIFIGLALAISACGDSSVAADLDTNTKSRDLGSQEERVEFLSEYVVNHSEVEDAEFDIVYHDNSAKSNRDIPGPSEWDIKAAIKLQDPETVTEWLNNKVSTEPINVTEWETLQLNDATWRTDSEPAFYAYGNTFLVVFEPEGILYFKSKVS